MEQSSEDAVILLFDGGDELVGALVSGACEPWDARALALAEELGTGVTIDERADWANASTRVVWWENEGEDAVVQLSETEMAETSCWTEVML